MKGAKGVLINITGGPDLMLFEVEQAANRIRAEVDPDANIIFGNTILDDMEGRIRVSVVATGIDAEQMRMPLPEKVRPLHPHLNLKSPARVAQAGAGAADAGCRPPIRSMPAWTRWPAKWARHQSAGRGLYPGRRRCPGSAGAARCRCRQVSRHRNRIARWPNMPLAPEPQEEKKSGWGFFGRKKAARRHARRAAAGPRQAPAPRRPRSPCRSRSSPGSAAPAIAATTCSPSTAGRTVRNSGFPAPPVELSAFRHE